MDNVTRLSSLLAFLYYITIIAGALNKPRPFSLRPHGTHRFSHRALNLGQRMTEDGKKCKFPFRFGGRVYFTCITRAPFYRKWCATTHSYDRDREWGYCTDTDRGVAIQNYCAENPCEHGGTCYNVADRGTYHCICPEGYTGKDCEKEKCFDKTHYEFYDIGASWPRIHIGRVESCTCFEGNNIMCLAGERYKACIENPCLNGGACRLMSSSGKTVCGCRGEHVGKYCNIDIKQSCYDSDNATEYQGIEKRTQSGHSCLPWNSDMLYEEIHTGQGINFIAKGLGSHPYCRSPDNDEIPWCYLMKDRLVSWEHCRIPKCDKGRRVVVQEDAAVSSTQPKCGKKHEKRVVARGRILDSPPKSKIRVVLGQQSFNQTTDVTQTFEVERYIFYDKYSVFKGPRTEHDIVLIKLKRVNNACAKKNQFVQTICLPDESIPFTDDHHCQIAGWGRMHEDSTEYAQNLQEAIVPLVPDNKCSSPEIYGAEISENMFCAGYFDCTIDACQGDSGGPLACEKDKISYLWGIVSWGDGCGSLNKPGVYTKVSNYVDWINRKIMPKKTD
ncbi:hypothetical protein XELAEV_18008892mg [Xenopus laevis]|uniref:Hepatocyte growth factor activator n=1 Tax=Xenopus laevis TaxID=8355 RepID=A0A974DTC5_XENLA|nr:hypothetical protein XELAEV_18008892mg [Xenopus laevis]